MEEGMWFNGGMEGGVVDGWFVGWIGMGGLLGGWVKVTW